MLASAAAEDARAALDILRDPLVAGENEAVRVIETMLDRAAAEGGAFAGAFHAGTKRKRDEADEGVLGAGFQLPYAGPGATVRAAAAAAAPLPLPLPTPGPVIMSATVSPPALTKSTSANSATVTIREAPPPPQPQPKPQVVEQAQPMLVSAAPAAPSRTRTSSDGKPRPSVGIRARGKEGTVFSRLRGEQAQAAHGQHRAPPHQQGRGQGPVPPPVIVPSQSQGHRASLHSTPAPESATSDRGARAHHAFPAYGPPLAPAPAPSTHATPTLATLELPFGEAHRQQAFDHPPQQPPESGASRASSVFEMPQQQQQSQAYALNGVGQRRGSEAGSSPSYGDANASPPGAYPLRQSPPGPPYAEPGQQQPQPQQLAPQGYAYMPGYAPAERTPPEAAAFKDGYPMMGLGMGADGAGPAYGPQPPQQQPQRQDQGRYRPPSEQYARPASYDDPHAQPPSAGWSGAHHDLWPQQQQPPPAPPSEYKFAHHAQGWH
jgi:hypothetical protein